MTIQQARRLKPGQELMYDNDPSDYGVVLGILRSGVSIHFDGDIPVTAIILWKDVEHIQVWQPS